MLWFLLLPTCVVISKGSLLTATTAHDNRGGSVQACGQACVPMSLAQLSKYVLRPGDHDLQHSMSDRDPDDTVTVGEPEFSSEQVDAATLRLPETDPLDETRTPSIPNLCATGKGGVSRILPQFFLLGAQKAATTSFAQTFFRSASLVRVSNASDLHIKEPHVLDSEHNFEEGMGDKDFGGHWNNRNGGGIENWDNYEHWINRFPECRQDVRLVGADCTPALLRRNYAVSTLHSVYGEKSSQIQFAFILREPVARMHSAYKMAYNNRDVRDRTFEDIASEDVATGGTSEPFQDSVYPPQLKMWFRMFSPTQFFVMMMKDVVSEEAVKPETSPFYFLWERLDMQIPSKPLEAAAANTRNADDALEDAISDEGLRQLRATMYNKTGPQRVANVLFNSGAWLWGCKDCDITQVAEWIEARW